MIDGTASATMRATTHAVAVALVAIMLSSLVASDLTAQTSSSTITAPKLPPKSTQSPGAKTEPGYLTPCSLYGEGFVRLPGTDTCVKVGGYVRSDVGVNRGH
jgi:hypothetical protein